MNETINIKSKIRVSGNIIDELSEKIPSNIIALNELIKNAYDAGANMVSVNINTNLHRMVITDNGCGMDLNDIKSLIHISKSEKKYGEINQYGRYTQGSKGLGFLSAFKFGKFVEWKTNKDKGYKFSINYSNLVKTENITDYELEIQEDDTFIEKGTKITITIDTYNLQSLLSYFSQEKYFYKLMNAINDKNFVVKFQIDKQIYNTNQLISIENILPEQQLYNIKYNSTEQKIGFYYNEFLLDTVYFPFHSNKYKLELDLVIFHLHPNQTKSVHKLFHNMNDELTPLIYINSNLFNNYSIFNPKVMQKIKSSNTLSQMIGYIKITCVDPMMNFNSDRTQFLQNELTDNIIQFLGDINKEIQIEGSKRKHHLIGFDILIQSKISQEKLKNTDLKSLVKSDFYFKDKVKINIKDNIIEFSAFGKKNIIGIESPSNKTPLPSEAYIKLKKTTLKIIIPSGQINLYEQILEAKNSSNRKVDHSQIIIKINGILSKTGILESINTPGSISVIYTYEDSITGNVIVSLNIEFIVKENPIQGRNKKLGLISLSIKENYILDSNPNIINIINQINSLDYNIYKELIACSLRSLFEISIDDIKKSTKYKEIFVFGGDLKENVKKLIQHVVNVEGRNFLTEVDKNTGLGFNAIKGLLTPANFETAITNAHLGAHKSTTHVTTTEIEDLAKKAGFFIVIINEMLKYNE